MGEENIFKLDADQLNEVAGGLGHKGGKGSRLLETVKDIESCASFDSCRDYVQRYKQDNETRQWTVTAISYLLQQNGYTLYYGVVEAFVDKYWDLV